MEEGNLCNTGLLICSGANSQVVRLGQDGKVKISKVGKYIK